MCPNKIYSCHQKEKCNDITKNVLFDNVFCIYFTLLSMLKCALIEIFHIMILTRC